MPIEIENITQQPHASVCNGGRVRCFAQRRTDETGRVKAFATASGIGATDLASAYALDTSFDPSATIAIVDAYGYTNLASDLAQYRTQYGLPACTVANGCLKIVNQQGQTSPLPSNPPANDDWTVETALDVDMASAACPKCKILVVQATTIRATASTSRTRRRPRSVRPWSRTRGAAPKTPRSRAARCTSTIPASRCSWRPATTATPAAGPDYPSTSAYTIGVGGTSLTQATSSTRGWTESAWSSGGSSCSQNVAKPAWQTSSACAKRATSDVSAVGDPNTGVAVYNGGWQVVGGTARLAVGRRHLRADEERWRDRAVRVYERTRSTTSRPARTARARRRSAKPPRAGTDRPAVGTPNGAMLAVLGGGGTGSGSGSGTGSGSGRIAAAASARAATRAAVVVAVVAVVAVAVATADNGDNGGRIRSTAVATPAVVVGAGLLVIGFAFVARRRRR